MLNYRKLRQDFSQNVLKEGKELFEKEGVVSAKIISMDERHIKLSCRVKGAFDNFYESEIEIDRVESTPIDSNCDCSYTYDCQHLAAFLFYLENHLNEIVVSYANEADLTKCEDKVKEKLEKTFQEAASKEGQRKSQEFQKETLSDYMTSAKVLGKSPFFLLQESFVEDKGEVGVIFGASNVGFDPKQPIDFQLAIRLPSRSKPLHIPHLKQFFEALSYKEPLIIGGKKYCFSLNSFEITSRELLSQLMSSAKCSTSIDERAQRSGIIEADHLGTILSKAHEMAMTKKISATSDREPQPLPGLYSGTLEEPLCYSNTPVQIQFKLEYLEAPGPTLMLDPALVIEEDCVHPKDVLLFESARPGLIYKNVYYRFYPQIKRIHLKGLSEIRELTIPEPLFGTFIENSLPVLRQYAEIIGSKVLNRFVTLPYPGELKGRCVIHYLNGELEAGLFFIYENVEIPVSFPKLEFKHVSLFIGKQGILARDLVEERKLIDEIFQDFIYDEKEGIYRVKSEKKIVEFMTDVIPKFQHKIQFECPENLSEQFIYDESSFELHFRDCGRVDAYEIELKVDGYLNGVNLDLLWECASLRKRFLELETGPKKKGAKGKIPKILVLDLEKLSKLIHAFDEIGIQKLTNHKDFRPLWSLTGVQPKAFENLPLKFSMTKRLEEIQKQIVDGSIAFSPSVIPKQINASLRNYQHDGVQWLERLRKMHLNGILADDMGLGKTLQAIIAVTQSKMENPSGCSLIVCPTSLVYNWKEEFNKFNKDLKVLVVDNIPSQRKKMLKEAHRYDTIITSYNLLQKDIEIYKEIHFDYAILDEAQHIKNRGTRNARSVKMIQAAHRLILTGTPIENSLEELWSLFDFLMPGLLSTYERFVEKYIRTHSVEGKEKPLEILKRKVSPFILRRMKEDVLDDLPPVSEIVYHCHLSDMQRELYHSYAASAKEELSRLVQKEGFDKIQIHVLATLTRLKQICCHPAIFAKEKADPGDSSKYDMLMELLQSLIEGGHKTVIFSQYTKMLTILREDLTQKGIHFAYLDGSSKNRLNIVNEFNENPNIAVFLVSLKAGGAGLNLVGADTVIHYDMWWNPAVENQATDRVHRIGQKKSVSSYKLITLNTIEEKILQLQNRKKGLVKKVINSDEETISRLTWEEVLELLQT